MVLIQFICSEIIFALGAPAKTHRSCTSEPLTTWWFIPGAISEDLATRKSSKGTKEELILRKNRKDVLSTYPLCSVLADLVIFTEFIGVDCFSRALQALRE